MYENKPVTDDNPISRLLRSNGNLSAHALNDLFQSCIHRLNSPEQQSLHLYPVNRYHLLVPYEHKLSPTDTSQEYADILYLLRWLITVHIHPWSTACHRHDMSNEFLFLPSDFQYRSEDIYKEFCEVHLHGKVHR